MTESSWMESLVASISVDPEIMGGTPVFRGTRVPVAVLFENLAGGLSLDEILNEFPSVGRVATLSILKAAQGLIESHSRALAGSEFGKVG